MSLFKTKTFPRRLFFWFLRKQIIVAAICLVVLDILILLWLEGRGLDEEGIKIGRQVVLISLASASLVLVGVSLFMARRLMGPLGRLIAKTEQLRRYPFEEEGAPLISLEYDEPGEWYDLERALNELGRALREKTIRLSREKTELRAIMGSMNEFVLAVNRELGILFFNPQMAVSLLTPDKVGSELTLPEIIRAPDVLEAYKNCLHSGEIVHLETRLEMPGIGTRYFRLSLAPLRKKHNQEIYGVVGVFHDISDLKRAEQIRIDFMGNVSHELRTPLTSIKGYLETAVHDIKSGHPEQSLQFLDVVSRNVDRLQGLVNDLLDLSSLQGGVELRTKALKVQALTEMVLNQIDHRGHVVQTDYQVSELTGDPHWVEQLLRNLLQNAVRYVPAGGRVHVRWLESEEGIQLEVADNGPGIAPEHLPRIFERFYRVDEARARQVGGTGIGLSLVKHIMQRHGGSVEVFSKLGRGTRFVCHFPQ